MEKENIYKKVLIRREMVPAYFFLALSILIYILEIMGVISP